MERKPLGISDRQLELIIDAAIPIERVHRTFFLAAVFTSLKYEATVTDADVEEACRFHADRMKARGRKGAACVSWMR